VLERRDVDRQAKIVNVRGTVSDGVLVELGKTSRSRRQVPLTPRALAALDDLPAQLRTPLVFPAPAGGLLNLDNFRRREWAPAIENVRRCETRPPLRPTLGVRLERSSRRRHRVRAARVKGTSVAMIERHYGMLLDGAHAGIAARLAKLEAEQTREADAEAEAELQSRRLGH
jgi:integrase